MIDVNNKIPSKDLISYCYRKSRMSAFERPTYSGTIYPSLKVQQRTRGVLTMREAVKVRVPHLGPDINVC